MSLPCRYVASKISATVFSEMDGDVSDFFAFPGNGLYLLFVCAMGREGNRDILASKVSSHQCFTKE